MTMDPAEVVLFAGRAAILVIALLAFAIGFSRWRRAAREDTQQLAAALEQALLEVRSLTADVKTLGVRFEELNSRLAAQAKQAAATASGSTPRGYDVAIRLARNGASPDELIATSGVTREEARLLTRLHGPNDEANDNQESFRAIA
jgi:hypothetical protein